MQLPSTMFKISIADAYMVLYIKQGSIWIQLYAMIGTVNCWNFIKIYWKNVFSEYWLKMLEK